MLDAKNRSPSTGTPKSGWLQLIATMPIEEVREILKRSGMPRHAETSITDSRLVCHLGLRLPPAA